MGELRCEDIAAVATSRGSRIETGVRIEGRREAHLEVRRGRSTSSVAARAIAARLVAVCDVIASTGLDPDVCGVAVQRPGHVTTRAVVLGGQADFHTHEMMLSRMARDSLMPGESRNWKGLLPEVWGLTRRPNCASAWRGWRQRTARYAARWRRTHLLPG